MKKIDVINHLKEILKTLDNIGFDNEDIRLYTHINREKSKTDIEIGGATYKH